jgi:anthranilate synthase component 2
LKVLLLDNYDSFTYNLVHLTEKILKSKITVRRNDEIEIEFVDQFDKILLSPGPGLPSEAGKMRELLHAFHNTKSIFGVCLGMQAIAEFSGAKLKNLKKVFHGIATPITTLGNDPLFKELPNSFLAGRYHSWAIDEHQIPETLDVIARDNEETIMAIRHKKFDLSGVQFHPESILSEHGERVLINWLLNS